MKRPISFLLTCLLLNLPLAATPLDENRPASQTADTPNLIAPLLIGIRIPDLTLTSSEGKEVNLSAVMEMKPTILVFYRGGW